MPWFYVDDGFSDAKPVLNMPDRYRLAACGLWVLAGSWSAKEELDGFVPSSKLRQLGARPPIIAALTAAGPMSAPLCTEVSGGIQFNSWEKWQPTKAELEAERIENARKREADAERKRAERAAKNGDDPGRPRRRRKGRNAVTCANATQSSVAEPVASEPRPNGHNTDVQRDSRAYAGARLDPTRPDPTRPISSSGYLGEGTHVSNGAPTPPPRYCDDHPNGTDLNCRACGIRRKAREAWDTEHAAAAEASKRAAADAERQQRIEAAQLRAHAVAACTLCDETGYRNGVVCDHVDRTETAAAGAALVRAALAKPNRNDDQEHTDA